MKRFNLETQCWEEEEQNIQKGVRALQLLQMAYRGEIELTAQQFRAAKEALPFEEPKRSAVTIIDGGFGEQLERAIRASGKEREVKQIEAHAITSEKSG